MHRTPSALVAVCLTLAALPAATAPSEVAQPDRPFGSDEQVTAVDLIVELDPPHRLRPWIVPPTAADLVAVMKADGSTPAVIAVDPPPREPEAAAWSIVLYFDLVLSDRIEVSWAADTLSRNLDELTRRGEVEVVLADPEPRTVVSPTRDTAAIDKVLERLLFFNETEDALVEARLERAAASDGEAVDVDGEVTPLERGLVQGRLDALLLALADRTPRAHPRRLVLLASGGYDLGGSRALTHATDETARALAAYGWSVAPVLVPPPRGPERGLRIGKWLFRRPEASWYGLAVVLYGTRESERDPELARAYLELAESRRDQGELEGAATAARRSLTHFSDDPRTAGLQAKALLVLAGCYEGQGRHQLARRTYLRAATRDPEGLADHPEVVAAVSRPEEALARLADATLGQMVRSDDDWEELLHGIDRRGVVTIQLSGFPDGGVHGVETLFAETSGPVRSTGLIRFGTPVSVASARTRQLLDDVPAQGTLPVTAAFLRTRGSRAAADRGPLLFVRADLSGISKPGGKALLRTTLAVPGVEGEARVVHLGPELLDPAPSSPWGWELRQPLELPAGVGSEAVWGTVVVEELLSGTWGAALAQSVDPD